ncbi:hypothetical protein [Vibrio sp. SCSIO 43136]|uniref:hypothetical protein n=1 Tax=Vibrio sp. SCSIO 43136 TaxID=2819101 RepID=UPI002075344F|nr:hypothetical protein [Vibrio sp. SCSIO 43136]USD67149.1 hypothetical protein J4N39_21165 [Vibrio sp. SCSIO 43136]
MKLHSGKYMTTSALTFAVTMVSFGVGAAHQPRFDVGDLGLGEFGDSGESIIADVEALKSLAGELDSGNYSDVQLNGARYGSVIVRQVGSGNAAQVSQTNTIANRAYIRQKGVENTAIVNQGSSNQASTNNLAYIEQWGEGHTGYVSQEGNNNVAILKQCELHRTRCVGEANGSSEWSISQTGDGNVAAIYDSANASFDVNQTGGEGIVIINHMNRDFNVN